MKKKILLEINQEEYLYHIDHLLKIVRQFIFTNFNSLLKK
jgi:hypothetical protein